MERSPCGRSGFFVGAVGGFALFVQATQRPAGARHAVWKFGFLGGKGTIHATVLGGRGGALLISKWLCFNPRRGRLGGSR